MMNYREIKNERKSRKKGLWYSIGFHVVLVSLLLFPFFNQSTDLDKFDEVVVVDFSSGSSLKGASGSTAAAKSEAPKRETKAVEKMTSTPPKKVLTQENSPIKTPTVKEAPKRVPDEFKDAPTKLEKTQSKSTVSSTQDKIDVPVVSIPLPRKEGGGASTGGADDSGSLGTGGSASTADTGSGGADSGSGKSDTGAGEDNSGSGLFGEIGELSRTVIYRPSISEMIRENSVIKVRICVARDGHVVDYAYESNGSTVKDKKLIDATLNIISQYKFEPLDYGPVLECGIFTVRVNMN